MTKETKKVIKRNLSFKELPKEIKEAIIDNEASTMVITFDEGVYTKKTALIDAKQHYENCDFTKYILYYSNIDGLKAENQEGYDKAEEDADWWINA
tara:strand:+ start:214 stop:501 length:288 start_codon:yes stop_codon:yes gene_type:complete